MKAKSPRNLAHLDPSMDPKSYGSDCTTKALTRLYIL
jgi:hypothetical protein